jgi:hypothetical protein
MNTTRWSTEQFSELSWHDNHIHGFGIREGEHGEGELLIDLDFILEWLCDSATGQCRFRLAPATSTFHGVSDLAITLDYALPTAALAPASIAEISREACDFGLGHKKFWWSIHVNWPTGKLSFLADGFTQVLRGEPVIADQQCLSPAQRNPLLV